MRIFLLRLVLVLTIVHTHSAAAATAGRNRVHHGVYRRLQQVDAVDIVVHMSQRPQEAFEFSSDSISFPSRGAKISHVVGRLESLASTSQRSIDKLLANEATTHTLFESQHQSWIMNARYFHGATLELVEALAALEDIAEIREEDSYEMDDGIVVAFSMRESPTAVQWGVDRINAPQLWALGVNGSGVVVGSIDSGVRGSHELLRANFRNDHGWFSPADRSAEPRDLNGHGTHTVGTMVGSGGIGVAPMAQWMACVACPTTCTEAAIVQCTEWMLCPTDTNGNNKDCSKAPHVINNSWSTKSGNTRHQPIIDAWVTAGIVPIFSNGNEGPTCSTVRSPGEYPSVISVGSIGADGSLAQSSSRGPAPSGLVKPDLSAPGQRIASASYLDDQSLRVVSGTSMAAPHVAGAVALLLSAKPELSVAEIRKLLTISADRIDVAAGETTCDGSTNAGFAWPNNNYGHGVLDVLAAYEKLGPMLPSPASATPPQPTPSPSTPAPSSGSCVLEQDVDFAGNDIGNVVSSTPAECCSLCLELTNCRAFTWSSYNGGTCWFKDRSTGTRVTTKDAVSAAVDRDSDSACRIAEGFDYSGKDLMNVASQKAGACCSLCAERRTQGCRAYTWSSYQGGTCWLKTAKGTATASAGLVSGEYGF